MPTFRFAVTETRNFDMEYVVVADTEEEARGRAEVGDTAEEIEIGCTGVSDRLIAEKLEG